LLIFYPQKFKRDLNGKSKEWKSVILLPFINEKELLEKTSELEKELTEEEKKKKFFWSKFNYCS